MAVQHDNRTVITDAKAACSRASLATCSPQARTHTWDRRTARTGSRRPGNRAVGYPEPPRTLETVRYHLAAIAHAGHSRIS